MQMEEVRCVVYYVTVVVGGGIDVMMACWRLSDSLNSPHALCKMKLNEMKLITTPFLSGLCYGPVLAGF